MLENLDLNELLQLYVIPWGTRIIFAIAIFYIGRIVVAAVARWVEKFMRARHMDEVLVKFLTAILHWALLLFVIIAALSKLGIDTTSMVALLGAAGLAIGLSLQGSLSNLAAGVLLIIFRPFTKGNFVEAGGAMGTVENINIFTTTLTTPDNKEIIVPNSAVLGNNITNFSARPTRRVDLVVGELADSSVNFLVRPWVKSEDYWAVFWDTTEAVKLRFDDAGITIPFPQMDVHTPQQD